jgi:hypothetical protein
LKEEDLVVVMSGRIHSPQAEQPEAEEGSEPSKALTKESRKENSKACSELGLGERETSHKLEKLWQRAVATNKVYVEAKEAVKSQERQFPVRLGLKCSISECSVKRGELVYRGRQ